MSSTAIKPSKFEIIPNEILLDIFEYLPTYDIFQTFYYLNKRYNQLLVSLHLRIDLYNVSKKIFDFHNYFVFSLVPHRIVSFRCDDIFDRFSYQIRLTEFIALKYLTIGNLSLATLRMIIPQLNQLQELIYLNLQTRTDATNNDQIVFQGQLPLIQRCILNFNQQISFPNEHVYSHLKYLTINQCNMEDLCIFIHTCTARLQLLTVTLIDGKLLNQTDQTHHLKSLTIHTQTIPFHQLANSLFSLLPYLQRLSINATGINYINGKQWETLLSSHFRHLINFQLHITFPQEEAPTSDDRLQLLKAFETSYFRYRKWYFAFIHRPSMRDIEFFSLPMITENIDVNLYNTNLETTMNDENIFQNIHELSLFLININENATLFTSFFPNVKKLKLISQFGEYQPFPKNLFVDISRLVKFSHLQSIEFVGTHFPSSSFVLLDYTSNLQSLTLTLANLIKMTKMLSDQHICQRLKTLIKHLTITSITNVKDLLLFERLPNVFVQLHSLSLSLENPKDLYILMTLLLSKMAPILKTMNISIGTVCDHHILDQFMIWLIDYMHKRDLDLVDVKLTGDQLSFGF